MIFLLFLRTTKIFSWRWTNEHILLLFWRFQISTWSMKHRYFYFFENHENIFIEWKKSINFIAFLFQISTWSMIKRWYFYFFRTKKIFSLNWKNQQILLLFGCFRSVHDQWNVDIFTFFFENEKYFPWCEKPTNFIDF